MPEDFVKPRITPSRDSKYMGLAWIHAGFSKDPSTQVGAQIVSAQNQPLGSGYNGPPEIIDDNSFSWARPSPDQTGISKYDLIIHAEINAIEHCWGGNLANATLYVTALPCPSCMLKIVKKQIHRVVYMDFQSSKSSSLQNATWREKTFEIARRGGIQLELFKDNILWVADWTRQMKVLQLFESHR